MGMRRCASVARWAPREFHVAVARHRAGFGDWRVLPRGPGRAMFIRDRTSRQAVRRAPERNKTRARLEALALAACFLFGSPADRAHAVL
jgi:hypothetical protein